MYCDVVGWVLGRCCQPKRRQVQLETIDRTNQVPPRRSTFSKLSSSFAVSDRQPRHNKCQARTTSSTSSSLNAWTDSNKLSSAYRPNNPRVDDLALIASGCPMIQPQPICDQELEIRQSVRGHPAVVYREQVFQKSHSGPRYSYWRCSRSRKYYCQASLKSCGSEFYEIQSEHNHP